MWFPTTFKMWNGFQIDSQWKLNESLPNVVFYKVGQLLNKNGKTQVDLFMGSIQSQQLYFNADFPIKNEPQENVKNIKKY